jgi:hypothetical protein
VERAIKRANGDGESYREEMSQRLIQTIYVSVAKHERNYELNYTENKK